MASGRRHKARREKRTRQRQGRSATRKPSAFREAAAHYEAGRSEEAERLCRQALAARPDQPRVLHLLAVIAHERGDNEEATSLLQQALALDGSNPVYHHHLGEVLRAHEAHEAAIAAYRQALYLDSNQADAWYGLGNALFDLRQWEEAAAAYQRGLALTPDDAELHNNLANTLAEMGDPRGAIEHYRAAVRLHPDYFDAWVNLGDALAAGEDDGEALRSYRAAVRLRPDSVPALLRLGHRLRQAEQYQQGIDTYRKVLALAPESVQAHNDTGYCLEQLGRPAEAMAHFERALELAPERAEVHANIGLCLQNQGRFDEAIAAHRRALALAPDLADAYLHLVLNRNYRVTDEDVRTMNELLEQPSLSSDARVSLSFALAHVHDARDDVDGAFELYRVANALKARSLPFDPDRYTSYTERIIQIFDAGFFAQRARFGVASETPVFIVGMPRSGSSLVEQILASHPDVVGAGELQEIRVMIARFPETLGTSQPFPECVSSLDAPTAQSLAEGYLEALRGRAGDALRVTDKMLGNFQHLGLIALLFPRARVIHCRRDPLDTCVSCYLQNFVNGLRFTYDMEHLGIAYRGYERLIAHWREALPLRMLDVQYEALVADLEQVSRELIEFLELPWDERCLAFHEQERDVRTASFWQVRQPLYASSVGRWRRYEKHLDPLIHALAGGGHAVS
ncbi:MAG: tetratricopeptide repeat protein [Gammaproteobacteria bacterium]|nr:tetratricopeptide repeat protein [Gammaproteobacteria bacterium]NIR83741.1 tetratricopeptide repeat protein [Gammaproteobacteria bacterium]NIR92025.1 tetratricopeptide repeat protein [Gammaproteobacteria bacterium]NIU04909.1 tetratricopeptide repeat protein [Gammaproteobacteria bacterium]NIV51895.1 tetratricopeptide repeat protein [Gammaproteobacteria bacterium]